MLKIALIGHSTCSDNLGVGALTVADIDIIRRAAQRAGTEARILVVDWKEPREPYVAGTDIDIRQIRAREIVKPWGYARLIGDADMVIDIGGGDSFADIYGGGRLRRMMAMRYIAHALGRPVVMAPQTIGPFNGRIAARVAAATVRACRLVAARDEPSVAAARAMGRTDVILASDVALRLPYEAPPPRPPGGPVQVGINVSGLLMNGGYTRNNMFGLVLDYPALMRGIAADFAAQGPGIALHFVPHVIRERGGLEDDLTVCRQLAAEHPGAVVAPAFASPSEAKSYIAGLDFFMGARMHACIAAFSAGVPVVPMAYSRKFAGLFGSLGYGHTVDCTAEDEAAIRHRIAAAFAARADLAAETRAALARGLERLQRYEDALVGLMERRLRRKVRRPV
ncbi:MAG: polysaccharide pyruvyl transferase family protein [Gemmobacter sp.]